MPKISDFCEKYAKNPDHPDVWYLWGIMPESVRVVVVKRLVAAGALPARVIKVAQMFGGKVVSI